MPKSLPSTASLLKLGSIGSAKTASSDSASRARGPLRSIGGSLEPSGIQTLVMHGVPRRRADRGADAAAGDAVIDPEPPDARVGVGQGIAVGGQRVGEVRRVEVHADPPRLRPVDPAAEVLGLERVALDLLGLRLGVAGVEVQAVGAGQEGQGPVEVGCGVRPAVRALPG